MKPVYTDIHIHTSANANSLNPDYNVNLLLSNVKKMAKGHPFLISLTDHNIINAAAYERLSKLTNNFMIGAELHIKKDSNKIPYHCHIFFKTQDLLDIKKFNTILNDLYEEKLPNKHDVTIPTIGEIVDRFIEYDFVMLPHGGQNHNTFNDSVDFSNCFDKAVEKMVYHNYFSGFTARSNKGLNKTLDYLEKLGINEFVNLITCSDNYSPSKYPLGKNNESDSFIPTWMLSEPTYEGFRLALSENQRLVYSREPPEKWHQILFSVNLDTPNCKIDVQLTPGLNIVIGSSSSGKSLFVDSLCNKLSHTQANKAYSRFNVDKINIEQSQNITPYYIKQNFISSLIADNNLNELTNISIINRLFPANVQQCKIIDETIYEVVNLIKDLAQGAKECENASDSLSRLPELDSLIIDKVCTVNLIDNIYSDQFNLNCHIDDSEYKKYNNFLDELKTKFEKSNFDIAYEQEICVLKRNLEFLHSFGKFCTDIEELITNERKKYYEMSDKLTSNEAIVLSNRHSVLEHIKDYYVGSIKFYSALNSLLNVDFSVRTEEKKFNGHKLFIEHKIKITPEILLELINDCVIDKIDNIYNLKPINLFSKNFKKNPKISNHDKFVNKITEKINSMNKPNNKIITNKGTDYSTLSPGWRTAILLELILEFNSDNAPIIIDQPEDNLANEFITGKLIDLIKASKLHRQIIFVTHNATIPILGDAQNIIYCVNKNNNITITSSPLESSISSLPTLEVIANVADGGKASIMKRVKKYDIKNVGRNNETKVL